MTNLPNPAYWDVSFSNYKLEHFDNNSSDIPRGLTILYAHQNQSHQQGHQQGKQTDVNASEEHPEKNAEVPESTLIQSLQYALRNGCAHHFDDVVTLLGEQDDEESHQVLYSTLVALVGKKAAQQYALSGRGVSVAKLGLLPHSNIVDPWKTYAFWSGVAPRVFSGGGADLTLSTQCGLGGGLKGKRMDSGIWFEHLVWANTNRFAQHQVLPLLAVRLLMQQQARGQAAFGLRQYLGETTLTHDEIRGRMEQGDETMFNKLFTLQGNVMGTAAYWAKFNKEVKASLLDVAYMEQTNPQAFPPTFVFNSQSCAEYWWPPLHRLFRHFHTTHACMDGNAKQEDISKISKDVELQWGENFNHCIHDAIHKYPQLLGDYFDKRTVNFHNTVGRALGISDSFLRYEYGSHNGHLHSHAAGLSTCVSVMVNEARQRASTEARIAQKKNECTAPKNTDEFFRDRFAHHLYNALSEHHFDGVGRTINDPGYSSWYLQSRHASSTYDAKNKRWTTSTQDWTPPEGSRPPPRGLNNPCSKTLADILQNSDSLREHRINMDNSSYAHKCTPYCTRLEKTSKRSNEPNTPFYRCRFGFAKYDKEKKLVWHRPAHDEPRFIKHSGQWRFEPPVDNWRVLPKPLATVCWFANEVMELVVAPNEEDTATSSILTLADYIADYTNKASDNVEMAKQLFRSLLQAKQTKGVDQQPQPDIKLDPPDKLVMDSSDANFGNNYVPVQQTLGSLLHSIMQRLAGLPVLTHLQAVMLLSGTPTHRSTRQTKCVSLSKNRVLRQGSHASNSSTNMFTQDEAFEQHAPTDVEGPLNRFFAFRKAQRIQGDSAQPLSLYKWLKRAPCKSVQPVVFSTGTNQLNFTWPMEESWARTMVLLHSTDEWITDEDALNGHATFHEALLDLCGFQETNQKLTTAHDAPLVPIGLKHLVKAAFYNATEKGRKLLEAHNARKRKLEQLAWRPTEMNEHFSCLNANAQYENNTLQKSTVEQLEMQAEAIPYINDQESTSAILEEEALFEPPPDSYNFHEAGRAQLHEALRALNVNLDALQPKPPLRAFECPAFEEDLAKVLQAQAIKSKELVSAALPNVPLLRASTEQRAAIARLILPVVERRSGNQVPPTRMKLLGEAGSGKTVVMLGVERLVKRLSDDQAPEKLVLGLAPTGAVAIGMGSSGHTIQSIIPPFRAPRSGSKAVNHTKSTHCANNQCSELDMKLSENRLKHLRAVLGYDSHTNTIAVRLLVMEEISMVGANLFWAIHCRLCQALQQDTRTFEHAFCALDVLAIGDFNQLDPIGATSLMTEVTKVSGLSSTGLFTY